METNPHPRSNLQSIFELILKYLPVGEFAFLLGPLILFGMFTWGLSPDDPQLRQGYFGLFLVVLPVAFILGNLLSRISRRRVIFGILDLASGILAGLCFLWFFAKMGLIAPESPVEYIGWNWREWYQFYLLLPLVGVKACRLGLIPNNFPTYKNLNALIDKEGRSQMPSRPTKVTFYATTSVSGIVALQYVGGYLMGFWPWLFMFIIFWDMFAAWYHLIPRKGNIMDGPRLALNSCVSETSHERLLRMAMPFMIGTQGIFWGLIYSTTMWSQVWIGLFGLAAGVATAFFIVFVKIRNENLPSRVPSYLPVIIVACLGASLAFLLTRWVQPMDVIWSVVNGVSLGGLLTMCTNLYSRPNRAFWGPFRLLAFIFLFVLGVGGGIAYFWYDPAGEMFGPWVLLACVLIAGVFTTIYAVKVSPSPYPLHEGLQPKTP